MSVTLAGEEHTIRVVDYDKHNSVAVVRLNKPTQTKQTNKQWQFQHWTNWILMPPHPNTL